MATPKDKINKGEPIATTLKSFLIKVPYYNKR